MAKGQAPRSMGRPQIGGGKNPPPIEQKVTVDQQRFRTIMYEAGTGAALYYFDGKTLYDDRTSHFYREGQTIFTCDGKPAYWIDLQTGFFIPHAGTAHRMVYMDAVFAQPEFRKLCDHEADNQRQQLKRSLFPELAP